MRYDPDTSTLELTTRNLKALKDKLDDPASARTLGSGCGRVRVRAVEDADRTDGQATAGTSEGIVLITRSEIATLLSGGTVIVDTTAIVPVSDSAHYTTRPAGDVYMPSAGELRPGVLAMSLWHICEVCGAELVLTPDEAHVLGWDYPPGIGAFGVIGPRTCGSCGVHETVWWALTVDGFTDEMLTSDQREVIARILAEPASIMVAEEDR